MPILGRLAWLSAALVASSGAVAWAVAARRVELAGLAAGAFASLLIAVGLLANRSLWRMPLERITPAAAPVAGVRNAVLIGLAYAWGAVTLVACYTLGGAVWQHGLQYATGMVVIAVGLGAYARALATPDSAVRTPRAQLLTLRLAILHAAGAAAGIGFLFLSGKIRSGRGDWPANIVFLMGGIAVMALSAMAAITQTRLSRRR